ncbi:histone-lysine N-methyltransferase SETMAR [Plakobranchus ocellatus]|uniref:Histone-lysine N-methyltransferase SETMAR n=1 Tax=Plakobranchus ocellatus TaxID=259542 RepID=A0AAV4DE91_9GAST|nr:histone-lysine N-methyltransferase SETMAR [Plakobranchus ocellatus]
MSEGVCKMGSKNVNGGSHLQRVEISQRLLQRCQQDNGDEDTTHIGVGPGGDFQANNNLFDNLITGDETWVHLNTPETKHDSMTWKHPSSPVTKKFKVQRSAAKVMATVFWDAKGVILLDILPQGQCINVARYCSTLDRLKEAIRRKRPGPLRRGVVLQHDNATPHSANLTQQWLQRYGWVILPHPAHSPDLAPPDFHLFGPLKRHLGGMAFETEDDLISELRNWFEILMLISFEWVSIRCCRAGKNVSISTRITLKSSGRVNFNLCEFQIYLIKTL